MPDTATDIALRGKQLPREERERPVDKLLESLNEPAATELDAAWSAEIERRLAAYASWRGAGAIRGRSLRQGTSNREVIPLRFLP